MVADVGGGASLLTALDGRLRRAWFRASGPGTTALIGAAAVAVAATLAGFTIVGIAAFATILTIGLIYGLPGRPLIWGAGVVLSIDVIRLLLGGSPLDDAIGGCGLWLLGVGLLLGWRSPSREHSGRREQDLTMVRPDRRVCAFFVVADVLINFRILLGRGIAINGDASSPWIFRNVRDVALYMFNDAGSVTNLENVDRALYALPVTSIVSLFHLGSGTYSKIQWLVFPLVSMIGCYLLLLHVLREAGVRVVRTVPTVVACLIFAFSPWVLEQVQANFYWLAYALTPFVVLASIHLASRPSVARCLRLSLLITLCGSTPQYFLFTCGLSAWVLVATYTRTWEGLRSSGTRAAGWLAGLGGMLAVLNASWLLPTYRVLKGGGGLSPGYSLKSSDLDLFSRNSSPVNILRGYDQWTFPYANDGLLRHLQDPWVAGLTVLVPLVAVWLLTNRQVLGSGTLRMLVLPTTLATALALGTRLPFYRWLLLDAPLIANFGWVLRVPGKLSYLVWLFLALVIGLGGHLGLPRAKTTVRILACGALSIGLVAGIAVKTASTFYHYYVPVSQPQEYVDLASFLSSQGGPGRVLYLAPYATSFGKNSLQFETSFTWNPSRVATNTPAISSPLPSIDYYHLTYRDWQSLASRAMSQLDSMKLGSDLLAKAGVRFVVYHGDIVGGEEQAREDVAALRRSDLRLCETFGSEIFLFCNPTQAPVIGGPGVAKYSKLNPTEYKIDLEPRVGASSRITFAQPYDGLWEFHYEDHVFEPQADVNGYMTFDASGGSGTGSLVYAPQRYYLVGVFISGAGLAALVLASFLDGHLRRRRARRPPLESAHRPGSADLPWGVVALAVIAAVAWGSPRRRRKR